MAADTNKKNNWRKRLLIAGLALVILLGAVYAYFATQQYGDTSKIKADYTVNALDFIREFQLDNKTANEKYADKIVAVNGRVSEIEAADTTINVKFIDTLTGSYVIFAFQQQHLAEAKTIQPGDSISIKGSCSGGIFSDILEATAISFKRSAINN